MKKSKAEIVREYGPFADVPRINGVTFDGARVWYAADHKLVAFDPDTGQAVRSFPVSAESGTAFDGQHLYQISQGKIQKVDPDSGAIVATVPAPEGGNSGMAWAEGMLWVGQYRNRKILQVDPATGAVMRVIECSRQVTGVTWVDDELWHGTWDDDQGDLQRLDPATGEVLEVLEMPAGVGVSGLESDGAERFFCGGGSSGKVRAVRRPGRKSAVS
jgi:streptogramin lyase